MPQERLTDAPTLYTFGYEGHTVDTLAHLVRQHGIEMVADVRDSPYSRKPGFSKRELKVVLDAAGAAYVHLGELGSPAELRERLRHGPGPVDFEKAYKAHLAQETEALARLQDLARKHKTAMMCVEKRPQDCHRRFISAWLKERGWVVVDV